MEKILDEYLEKMEKYLKPIVASERIDIIKEIKSEMQELQNNDIPAEQIIERLGDPKDLAKKIDYWIEHPEEKAKQSKEYVKFMDDFKIDKCMDKMEEMFKYVLEESKKNKGDIKAKNESK